MARPRLLNGAFIVVLLAATSLAVASETAPAHSGGSKTKALTGKACTKSDAACVRCTKGKSKSAAATVCLACSDNGPVPAELAGGRCYCPAGSAVVGSANTVSSVATAGKTTSSSSPAHSSKGGKKGGGATPRACAPCAVDFYAPQSQIVASSKCKACPPGTFTNGATGSTTCYAPPGTYFNTATQSAESCPENDYCLGGDSNGAGKERIACPKGSSTQGTTGNSQISACVAPPGSYYDTGKGEVLKCPVGAWCEGGPVDGAGLVVNACPDGTTTSAPGASLRAQCTVPPGSFWNGSAVQQCEAGNFCSGGSVEGAGTKQTPCGDGETSNPGASTSAQCFSDCPVGAPCGTDAKCDASNKCVCSPGFVVTSTAPVACAACGLNSWCPGGTTSASDKFGCPLGTDTAGITTASSESQCIVSTCNPCGGSTTPTTYFTTGKAKSVYVVPALGPADPPPGDATLICTMPDSGEFVDTDAAINDVAATSTGKLLIAGRSTASNANGFILLLDPAAQTVGQPCVYRKLLDISPAVAGLGAGPKSDLFFGTGGAAFVYTYKLSEAAGVASLTPVGTADVTTVVGGAMGASDITAVPGNPNLLRFTSDTSGFEIGLDASGNPIAASAKQTTSGSIGLGAPAAWCNSLTTYAGSSSTDNAYEFSTGGVRRRRRQLLADFPPFVNAGETTMPAGSGGLSGAATLPSCTAPPPPSV